MEKEKIMNMVEELNVRGAWKKGVKEYACDLVEGLQVDDVNESNLEVELLNGAENWSEYSWSGCAFVYDGDIVDRLCTPSEIKRFHNGKLNRPNSSEEWLDTQARALKQAYIVVLDCLK